MSFATALVPAVPSAELKLPTLIAGAGDSAAWRFLEFFTVNIRNANTRAAYARAANPAHSVRGPRHSVSKGSTPVLASAEASALLESIAAAKMVKRYGMVLEAPLLVGLRDHALIAVMTYTFARVVAVVALAVEDYYPQNKRWWLRLHEKNGKRNEMPCHHKLEAFLDAYIEAAGLQRSQGAAVPLGNRQDRRAFAQGHVTLGCLADGASPRFGCRY